jgi:hypothetical protein
MSNDEDGFKVITSRLYGVISSPAEERDWESIRPLYHPRATLVRTGINADGSAFVLAMSFDEYVANATDKLRDVEFREVEVQQDVTVFGNIARVSSVYEYELRESGHVQTGRGVNFFNFVNEGDGWKITNIVWDNERDGVLLGDAGLTVS